MLKYGFTKSVDAPFETVLERTKKGLQEEGFGILANIDLRAKFKEKLGIDFRNYVILGACHPPSAYAAIEIEENIGLFLPCNVVIYERGDKTVVSIIKPTVAMQMIENDALRSVAAKVEQKLEKVFRGM